MRYETRRGDQVAAGDTVRGPEELRSYTSQDEFLVLVSRAGVGPHEGHWRIELEAGGGHAPWLLIGTPEDELEVRV